MPERPCNVYAFNAAVDAYGADYDESEECEEDDDDILSAVLQSDELNAKLISVLLEQPRDIINDVCERYDDATVFVFESPRSRPTMSMDSRIKYMAKYFQATTSNTRVLAQLKDLAEENITARFPLFDASKPMVRMYRDRRNDQIFLVSCDDTWDFALALPVMCHFARMMLCELNRDLTLAGAHHFTFVRRFLRDNAIMLVADIREDSRCAQKELRSYER